MDEWVAKHAADIAARAPRELEALVAVSSPSGDVRGAEECAALCAALAPEGAEAERIPCSSPEHAPDLLLRLRGDGHARGCCCWATWTPWWPTRRTGRSSTRTAASRARAAIDMKGGDVLALGVMRALAERPGDFGEVALLLVCDEEWRRVPFAHAAPVRRLGRLPVLRGRRADAGRRRRRDRAAQGGREPCA